MDATKKPPLRPRKIAEINDDQGVKERIIDLGIAEHKDQGGNSKNIHSDLEIYIVSVINFELMQNHVSE